MNLRQQGFSIVEFMIAIALGMLIIATVGQIYLSNRTSNNIQEGLARLQENARYANYMLAKDLRMAGYQGCGQNNNMEVSNLVPSQPKLSEFDIPLKGYDGNGSTFSPALPSYLSGLADNRSDVLEIRMASSLGVNLRSDMNQTNNPVLVYDRLGLQAGDIVMITDCSVADIFVAGSNSNATAITHTVANNLSNNLSIPYLTSAQVMRFLYFAYYIKNTGRTNSNGEPIYSLYRLNINGNEEEIAEGVERMEVSYAVDTDGDLSADSYQTAAEINTSNRWNSVIAVNINLLLATTENVSTKIQPYRFNGTNITPSDRKLRREWNVFVTLRNRGLPS